MKTIITNIVEVQENGYGTATDNRNKQYLYIEESKIDAFVTSCGDIEDDGRCRECGTEWTLVDVTINTTGTGKSTKWILSS